MAVPEVLCYANGLEVHAFLAVHFPAVAAKRNKVPVLTLAAYLSEASVYVFCLNKKVC